MSGIIVSIVHQISLAKFAFNLYEIAYKYNCEYCSAKFATVLSTSEILITKPVGPNKEVLIFEWDQKQDKPVS